MSKKKRKSPKKAPITKLDSLKQLNLNAAGLDIGAAEIWVCVPEDRAEENVRCFTTFTDDLHALADWLEVHQIDTVAMESTGIYWLPIYEILEARGLEVYLVNARHVKNVPGRKSDVMDCQWLQQLHTYGLLRGSFRPSAEIVTLRAYVRHRDNIIKGRVVHIQHMQKALELMNLKLTQVVTDITGVTGMQIIRAIIDGERDPQVLAQFRDYRCAKSEAEIARALHGNYRPEHLFMLEQAVNAFDFATEQLQQCDQKLEAFYSDFLPPTLPQPTDEPAKPRRKPAKNEPYFPLREQLHQLAGVDLCDVDGLNTLTVQTILSEISPDVSAWPTYKHFASWLGACPYQDQSGGKIIKRGTRKNTNPASMAFRMAAQAVSNSNSALGAYYRRKRAKFGPPKAITATAHKIARIVYSMLKYKQPYVDPGVEAYEQQQKEKQLKHLKKKAQRLGFELVELSA